LLSLIPGASEPWDEWAIGWMLDQTASPADAPWLVAACAKHTDLVRVAWKRDPQGAAEVLAEEWQAESRAGIVSPLLVHEVLRARVRPLYPLALELIAGMKVNHYAVALEMDKAVRDEKSEELEAAFREALTSCLKLKLEQKYYYGLDTVSRIALRHGVPLGIDGLLICDGATPAQLLKEARPFVELPSGEKEAIELLRTNAGRWEWEHARQRFAVPVSKHTELSGH
jgi:hypothetical protein